MKGQEIQSAAMSRWKRWAAATLCLCLILGSLTAARAEALGKILPGLFAEESAFEATISGTVEKYPPYAEKRLEQLNRLLSHLSLHLEKSGETAAVEMLVDDQSAVRTVLQSGENLSNAANLAETAQNGPFTDGAKAEPGIDRSLIWMLDHGEAFLDEAFALLTGLPEAFPESFKEGKENITYREYGPVKKKKIGSIAPEEGTGGMNAYLAGAKEPLASMLTKEPVLQGQQRVNLFEGEDGRILRLTYDGTIGRDADSLRKVSLNWRRLRTETKELDNLILKTPAVKGGERNNLTLERRYEEAEDGTKTLSCTLSFDDVADRVRTSTEISVQLQNQAGKITGELVRKEKTGNQLIRWYIRPELTIENETDYAGRLEIVRYSGKIEQEHATVMLRLSPGKTNGFLVEDASSAQRTAITEEQKEGQAEQLAAGLLQALLALPPEDLLFLTDGLTEADQADILHRIEPLEGIQP